MLVIVMIKVVCWPFSTVVFNFDYFILFCQFLIKFTCCKLFFKNNLFLPDQLVSYSLYIALQVQFDSDSLNEYCNQIF